MIASVSTQRLWLVLTVLAMSAATLTSGGCAAPTTTQTQTHVTQSAAPSLASVTDYERDCGICHLQDGAGVPGAFPPLNARLAKLSATEDGRNYLVGLLKNGLYGPILAGGTQYSGAMPPLTGQLDEPAMAGMLNYVMITFAATQASFTAAEIATRSEAIANTSSADLRKRLGRVLD